MGGKTPVHFINIQPALHADVREIVSSLGCGTNLRDGLQQSISHLPGEKNGVIELCRWAGIWGHLAPTKRVPSEFFAPDVSADVVANLMFGLFESDGWVSREQTGAPRVGYTTTSEQLAQQVPLAASALGHRQHCHQARCACTARRIDPWPACPREIALLGSPRRRRRQRAGFRRRDSDVGSTRPRAHDGARRAQGQGTADRSEVTCPDDDRASPDASSSEGGDPAGSHPTARAGPGEVECGLRQMLGRRRLRRDRVLALAHALDDSFLHDILAEELSYLTVTKVLLLGELARSTSRSMSCTTLSPKTLSCTTAHPRSNKPSSTSCTASASAAKAA